VGVFDYNIFTNGLRNAHYAAPTPSGDWVYLEDERGFFRVGGVHVLDTHTCDGTRSAPPSWWAGGTFPATTCKRRRSPILPPPELQRSTLPIENRSFVYDAHNLDIQGENTLLVANYAMGIRLVDTSNKSAPREVAFYLPNANQSVACKMDCGHTGRQTWGSYFGSDGLIYASDLSLGFFIVDPSGSRAGALVAAAVATPGASRSSTAAGSRHPCPASPGPGNGYEISFSAGAGVAVHVAIYDCEADAMWRM